jgi:hypothetical protein
MILNYRHIIGGEKQFRGGHLGNSRVENEHTFPAVEMLARPFQVPIEDQLFYDGEDSSELPSPRTRKSSDDINCPTIPVSGPRMEADCAKVHSGAQAFQICLDTYLLSRVYTGAAYPVTCI